MIRRRRWPCPRPSTRAHYLSSHRRPPPPAPPPSEPFTNLDAPSIAAIDPDYTPDGTVLATRKPWAIAHSIKNLPVPATDIQVLNVGVDTLIRARRRREPIAQCKDPCLRSRWRPHDCYWVRVRSRPRSWTWRTGLWSCQGDVVVAEFEPGVKASSAVQVNIWRESAERHEQQSEEEADGQCAGNHHDEGWWPADLAPIAIIWVATSKRLLHIPDWLW